MHCAFIEYFDNGFPSNVLTISLSLFKVYGFDFNNAYLFSLPYQLTLNTSVDIFLNTQLPALPI